MKVDLNLGSSSPKKRMTLDQGQGVGGATTTSPEARAQYMRYAGGFGGSGKWKTLNSTSEEEEDETNPSSAGAPPTSSTHDDILHGRKTTSSSAAPGSSPSDEHLPPAFDLYCLRKPLNDRRRQGLRKPFVLSSHTGDGVGPLKQALSEIFRENACSQNLVDRALQSFRPSLAGNANKGGYSAGAANTAKSGEAQKVPGKTGYAVDVANPNQTRRVTVHPGLKECYKFARREGIFVGDEKNGGVVVFLDGIGVQRLQKLRTEVGEFVIDGSEGGGVMVEAVS